MRGISLFLFLPLLASVALLLLLPTGTNGFKDDGERPEPSVSSGSDDEKPDVIRRADGPPIKEFSPVLSVDPPTRVRNGGKKSVSEARTSNSSKEVENDDFDPPSNDDSSANRTTIELFPPAIAAVATPSESTTTSRQTSVTIRLSTSTVSWLDVFMLRHRDALWKAFNSLFTASWFALSIFVLYRLLDLNLCSPHLSRTQYLVIHLLSFTAGVFEIVQLFHLNFGRHQGLPLFLTLLLTHMPTPLLASCIVTMGFCILTSSRVAIYGRYSPPLSYVGILCSLLILLSFLGDIVVGVTRSSVFLLLVRLVINVICIVCFLCFILRYKNVVRLCMTLRREFGCGALKSLAVPAHVGDESHERKMHLKEILLLWARLTLVSCISGIIMCICCFLMSIFFTVSHVPLWAFWVLHSTIFLMQITIVAALTIGATLTLTCCTKKNLCRQYFMPFMVFKRPNTVNDSSLKRGNLVYQRVSFPNGAVVMPTQRITVPISPIPAEIPEEEQEDVENDAVTVTEFMTPPPLKQRTQLRRSATFNCAPLTSHPFYGASPIGPQCSTPIYPVLSDHLLPQSNSQDATDRGRYCRSLTPSGHQIFPAECDLPYRYISRYPSKSYYARDHYSSLRRTHSARRQKHDISAPILQADMAGTVEALEIAYQPSHSIAMRPQLHQYSLSNKNSFNRGLPSPHSMKSDAPEKPTRKVEPILVRGVIKENGVLENSRLSETAKLSPITGIGSYSKREISLTASPPYDSPSNSPHPSSRHKDFAYGNNISIASQSPTLDRSLNKKGFQDDLPIHPVIHMNGNSKEFFSFNKASNPNLNFSPHSPTAIRPPKIAMGSRSPALSCRANQVPRLHNTSVESASLATPESISLRSSDGDDFVPDNSVGGDQSRSSDGVEDDIDNCSDKTLKDESSIASSVSLTNHPSEEIITATLPNDSKRKSLKRNHSIAGDFVPPKLDADESSVCDERSNKDKYPWYGTWGGRRNKKRNGMDLESGRGLAQYGIAKRSGSKTSLSSLYGKLRKPGRSRSMYHSNGPSGDVSMDESEQDETKSLDLDVGTDQRQPQIEEDDLFLPKLTEEIDLESEILKSSTMLANFYSLNRSELKIRRREREKEENQSSPDDWDKTIDNKEIDKAVDNFDNEMSQFLSNGNPDYRMENEATS